MRSPKRRSATRTLPARPSSACTALHCPQATSTWYPRARTPRPRVRLTRICSAPAAPCWNTGGTRAAPGLGGGCALHSRLPGGAGLLIIALLSFCSRVWWAYDCLLHPRLPSLATPLQGWRDPRRALCPARCLGPHVLSAICSALHQESSAAADPARFAGVALVFRAAPQGDRMPRFKGRGVLWESCVGLAPTGQATGSVMLLDLCSPCL